MQSSRSDRNSNQDQTQGHPAEAPQAVQRELYVRHNLGDWDGGLEAEHLIPGTVITRKEAKVLELNS